MARYIRKPHKIQISKIQQAYDGGHHFYDWKIGYSSCGIYTDIHEIYISKCIMTCFIRKQCKPFDSYKSKMTAAATFKNR